MPVIIITNNVPRYTIDAHELTDAERAEFDYLDWPAIDAGEESATFFRYRGDLYDLEEFMANLRETGGTRRTGGLDGWDGYMADSYYSAIIVKLADDCGESVIVGRCYS